MIVLKWILKISKYLLIITSSLFAVSTLALGLLLFTHSGNQAILSIVERVESRLSIELVEGAIFNSPHFEKIRWHDGETVVDIKRADYQFDWACLMDSLCLTRLNIDGVQISLPETNDDVEPEVTPPDEQPLDINIPIALLIGDLNITHLNFKMGQFAVDLDKISLQADAFQQDVNLSSQIAGLIITLPNSEQTQPAAIVVNQKDTPKKRLDLQIKSIPAILTAEMLPSVSLPINLAVEPINIDNLKVVQNNATLFQLNSLNSAFTFKESQLNIEKFDLDIPETTVNVNGHVDFIDDYPLEIEVKGKVKAIKQLDPENLLTDLNYHFSSTGSLSDLNSEINLSNKVALQLRSHINLFADNLPHQLDLTWQKLTWPLGGEKQYSSEQGRFTSKGSLLKYELDLQGDYAVAGIPNGAVSLKTQGGLQQLNIEQLKVETLSGDIDFSGLLNWQESIDWLGELVINNINLAELETQYDGAFSGNIKQQVSVTLYENSQPEWQFDFPELQVVGELLSRPVKVSGRVSGDDKKGILFEKLAINNEDNHLLVDGILAQNNDLNVALNLKDISHLILEAQGDISGDLSITGPNDALQIDTKLAAKSMVYQDNVIQDIALEGKVILTEQPQLNLQLNANDIDASGQHVDDIKLLVTNELLADEHYRHQIEIQANSELISTDLHIFVTQTAQKLLIQMDEAKINLPFQTLNLSNPFEVISKQNSIEISAHCWQLSSEEVSQAGKLCIKDANIGESGSVIFDIDNYLLSNITPFLPEQFHINGAMFADADMHWEKDSAPDFEVTLFSKDMILNLKSDPAAQTFNKYAVENFNINLQGDQQTVDVKAKIFSQNLIDVSLNGQLKPYQQKPTIDAKIAAHLLDFGPFRTLVPVLEQLAGNLNSDIDISGDLKNPTINGKLLLQDGQIASADLPMKITELNARVDIDNSAAKLSGSFNSSDTNTIVEQVASVPLLTNTLNIFDKSVKKVGNKILDHTTDKEVIEETAKASPGVAYINGQFDWSNTFMGDIHFYAHKLEVYDYGKIDLLISPDIHLSFNEHININGNLFIDKGKIVVKELAAGAISQSSDIVVVDIEQDTVEANLPVIINLGVDMGHDLQVIALGLDTFINGKLLIEKPLEKDLTINGVLQLDDGSYRALGQQLTLRTSRIIFQGAPDSPYLQIEAIRDPSKIEDDVTAGLRVTGTVDELELVIFSEPAMGQQEALSYLTRGQGLNSTSDSSTMANMLIDIAAGQSEGLMSTIGEEIGIKDLSLSSSGTGDEQSVGIRGEVAPGVEISYGVGVFDTFSILSLRYEILERLYLEASSGIYQAIDAYYEWDWD